MSDAAHPETPAARIAVFGAGLVGRRHAAIAARQGHLAGIVDPSAHAKDLAGNHGVPWFEDADACLAEAALDGVIIATPNQTHVDLARACVDRGLPVLIEKPIGDRSETAATLVAAAEAAGVPIQVGHHRRHNPLVAAAKTVIEAGELGRIVTVSGQFLLYKPEAYFSEHWRRASGAGPIFINLVHDIDLLRHLCGDITAVQATESTATRGFQVEDSAAVLLEFASGAVGTFTVSDTAVAPWSWEFTAGENPAYPHVPGHCYMISGTHASLSVPDLKLWHHPGERGWWNPIECRQIGFEPGESLDRQYQSFLDVVHGRGQPLVSGHDGVQSLRVIEAIKRAAENRARVAL